MGRGFGIICMVLLTAAALGCTSPKTQEEGSMDLYENPALARVESKDTKQEVGIFKGNIAPYFILEDMEGDIQNIDDFKGKVLFLNFWETTNGWSKDEMAHLEEVYRQHPEDLVVIGINRGEEKKDILQYIKVNKVSYPILFDIQERVAETYLIQSLPTTYVINRQGIIQNIHLGPMEKSQMETYLKAAMSE